MSNYDQLNLLPEPALTHLTRTAIQYYNSCLKEKKLTTAALHLVSGHLSEEQRVVLSTMVEEIVARDISETILNLHTWSFNPESEQDDFYAHIMQSDFQTLISVLDFYNHPSSEILKLIFETKRQQEEYNE